MGITSHLLCIQSANVFLIMYYLSSISLGPKDKIVIKQIPWLCGGETSQTDRKINISANNCFILFQSEIKQDGPQKSEGKRCRLFRYVWSRKASEEVVWGLKLEWDEGVSLRAGVEDKCISRSRQRASQVLHVSFNHVIFLCFCSILFIFKMCNLLASFS